MYTLRVTHKPYSVFEIYHVKYTNLVQSYTWPHFQFIVLLNLMLPCLVHRFHINTIFMHNVYFKSAYKPYTISEMLPC